MPMTSSTTTVSIHPDATTITDPIWGRYEIHEPLLRDLLQSTAVVRLRGVHQGGGSYLVRPGRAASRYEHVVGAMLCIRSLGGSTEEQAAGLLHDISHTAFSHVIDQVFDLREEDYHERHLQRLLYASDVPAILQRHSIDVERVMTAENWSLLEQPAPDLCADRVDYTLRDLYYVGHIRQDSIAAFRDALTVHDGTMACQSFAAASWFTEMYAHEVLELFMHPTELYANDQLARTIAAALRKGIVAEEDLFDDDEGVLSLLRAARDDEINSYLSKLSPSIIVVEDRVNFDLRVFSKGRVIDPLVVLDGGRAVRCSTRDPRVAAIHQEVLEKAREGICLRVVQSSAGPT